MEEEQVRPVVYTPTKRPRRREGRGFSREEIRRAGLTLHEMRRLGIPVDKRRKTSHPTNVQTLKERYGVVIPLTEIKGVGETTEGQLVDAGILDAYDLVHADLDSLTKLVSPSRDRLQKWQDEAKKLLEKK
jgi:large subunit ribosomal protein L13e